MLICNIRLRCLYCACFGVRTPILVSYDSGRDVLKCGVKDLSELNDLMRVANSIHKICKRKLAKKGEILGAESVRKWRSAGIAY